MRLNFKEWLGQQARPQPKKAEEPCGPGMTRTKKGCMKVLRTDPSSGMWIGVINGKHTAVHPDEIEFSS